MDSFEVENFRSLKHLKLEKLARVNLLVGKNNSGKTSVLEGLVELLNTGDAGWISILEKERGLAGSKSDFRYLFYGFDVGKIIKLSVTHRELTAHMASPKASFNVTISAQGEENKTPRAGLRNNFPVAPQWTDAKTLLISLQLPTEPKPFYFQLTRTNRHQSYLVAPSEETAKAFDDGVNFMAASRHVISEILTTNIDQGLLSQKVETLKFNKNDSQMLSVMQSIDSRIKSIELGAGGQIYFDLGKNFRTLLPLNLMGEGIQRLLDVITSIAHTAGGIVLIDEIDNGLHYSALRTLWKGLLQAAREYDVQVFATTHSAEALRHLTWVLDDEENTSYRDDVAAYTLIRADDDTVRSYRHDYGQLEYALEHGIEVRN